MINLPHTLQVSGAVCFLLSPAASYITGVAIQVDGGLTLYASQFTLPGKEQRRSDIVCNFCAN